MYGLEVDPNAKIWQLSVGEQQRVEIIKALSQGADLLILDEPTSVLTPKEVTELFSILRSMANKGLSIIFITHKLDEILSVSDRITVLRSGKVASVIETDKASKEELARLMVGRAISFECDNAPCSKGCVMLKIETLCAINNKGLDALRNVSIEVCEGEILGIAGVAGNGQKELVDVVIGLRRATKGKVLVNGRDVTNQSPKKVIEEKVTCVPEDRIAEGLILDFTIAENLILKSFCSSPYSKRGFLHLNEISTHAEKLVSEFDIKTPTIHSPTRNLSGGNLQKLLLARELSQQPKILIAAQPTKGLDVGATEYIHKKLMEQRRDGKAILLVSEDLDELLALSDRLAVMYQGKIVGLLDRDRFSIEEIGLMMTGAKKTAD
jgi:simple sugar transport system ATP-binding protein